MIRALRREARELVTCLPFQPFDRRFLLRAALMWPAKALAQSLDWGWLRDLFGTLVMFAGQASGLVLASPSRWLVSTEAVSYKVSVECTHIEFAALLATLLWSRQRGVVHNLTMCLALASVLFALGCLRGILALLLTEHLGASWLWAHDIPLGLVYCAGFVYALTKKRWEEGARSEGLAVS